MHPHVLFLAVKLSHIYCSHGLGDPVQIVVYLVRNFRTKGRAFNADHDFNPTFSTPTWIFGLLNLATLMHNLKPRNSNPPLPNFYMHPSCYWLWLLKISTFFKCNNRGAANPKPTPEWYYSRTDRLYKIVCKEGEEKICCTNHHISPLLCRFI